MVNYEETTHELPILTFLSQEFDHLTYLSQA